LIYVAPGVYTEQVTMKPYVDIEGAGELATKITYTGTNAFFTATVLGADNTELRFLTVENTGGNSIATAISDPCGITQRLTHITAIASEGSSQTTGVEVTCGDPSILTNVNATASGGTGVKYGLRIVGNATLTDVSGTASGGTGNNFGVWIGSYAPTLMNVTATASDGTTNYAVYNTNSSSPTLMNVIANASGGTRTYGVYNYYSSPTLMNITVSASGGTDNYGMWNESSSVAIHNSVISASGNTNDGIHNDATSGTYTVTIDASQITGNTSTIYQTAQYTTQIGASKLVGSGGQGSGTYKCVASYNATYDPLNTGTCRYP
jgi:hypothetical protein